MADGRTEQLFVGVDWGSKSNEACMINEAGDHIGRLEFESNGSGIHRLIDWILGHAGKRLERLKVGIERPRGPIVETLLERNVSVFSINPKQLDRFRDRFGVAPAKDDKRDARVLADSLRTDERAYRRIEPRPALLVELSEWTRTARDLTQQLVAQNNRFAAQLHRYYPEFLAVSASLNVEWVRALWEPIPTPAHAQTARKAMVTKVLRKNRARKLTADDALSILQTEPVSVAPGTTDAATAHIRLLLESIRLLDAQRRHARKEIDRCLLALQKEQRDVKILQSLPGVGRTILATLLAEASEPLARRDYHALRALTGAAPVTRQSGKTRTVSMRRACQPALRDAIYHWARIASMHDPHSKARYRALRARGKSHARSLRALADRLMLVACKILEKQVEFDPNHQMTPVRA